ncbi:receptor activity-modifying protein 1-like [Chelmon rostratus]|uniref:receptor activity-modifying protein 1-like n=1 Tax=Chelmon rostratus TaxID=109905 RepID=UPI001BEC6F9B|nr:receptor activity-modifying protein 1-like [Chelmon rostratus]
MVLSAYLLVLTFVWTGQAAKFVVPPCDWHMFESNVDNCLSDFNKSLEASGYQDGCPWPAVKGNYNKLKHCVDDWANESWCRGHRSLVDKVFMAVHDTHFSACGQVQDPPLTTLIMLIAPVIITTLLLPLLCAKLTTYNIEMPSSLGL